MLKIACQAIMFMRFVAMSRRIMERRALNPEEQGDNQGLYGERCARRYHCRYHVTKPRWRSIVFMRWRPFKGPRLANCRPVCEKC